MQDDGSRVYAWIMYSNFGRQLLCKVIMAQCVTIVIGIRNVNNSTPHTHCYCSQAIPTGGNGLGKWEWPGNGATISVHSVST